MITIPTVLDGILKRVGERLAESKSRVPVVDLRKRIRDIPPAVSFRDALAGKTCLIAEIKRKSPSQGKMRADNILETARIYERHNLVRALSVLTNRDDFGMSIEDLARVRKITKKPILRKDFIFDEYQVIEARAFGADAILLMASVVAHPRKLSSLYRLAKSLGMDVLFECRSEEEIAMIPSGATIYGINSRKMKAKRFLISRYTLAKWLPDWSGPDRSVQFEAFKLLDSLPENVVKIAESGMTSRDIGELLQKYHFNAALVGTALLNDSQGVKAALDKFEQAMCRSVSVDTAPSQAPSHRFAM